MILHSHEHSAREELDLGEGGAPRRVDIEPVTGQSLGTAYHAQEGLAEGRAPGSHGPDVPGAGQGRSARVSMEEPEDVSFPVLAIEDVRAVEFHARRLAAAMIDASREPDWATPRADERPALLDHRIQGS